jgi:hypothetical protein
MVTHQQTGQDTVLLCGILIVMLSLAYKPMRDILSNKIVVRK